MFVRTAPEVETLTDTYNVISNYTIEGLGDSRSLFPKLADKYNIDINYVSSPLTNPEVPNLAQNHLSLTGLCLASPMATHWP